MKPVSAIAASGLYKCWQNIMLKYESSGREKATMLDVQTIAIVVYTAISFK
jgi:hypothetical protein